MSVRGQGLYRVIDAGERAEGSRPSFARVECSFARMRMEPWPSLPHSIAQARTSTRSYVRGALERRIGSEVGLLRCGRTHHRASRWVGTRTGFAGRGGFAFEHSRRESVEVHIQAERRVAPLRERHPPVSAFSSREARAASCATLEQTLERVDECSQGLGAEPSVMTKRHSKSPRK